MIFEWDENKRLSNIEKHGIDFLDADLLFEGPTLEAESKLPNTEQRWLAVGTIHGLVVTAVYTRRNAAIRLISIRRARHAEIQKYRQRHERGT